MRESVETLGEVMGQVKDVSPLLDDVDRVIFRGDETEVFPSEYRVILKGVPMTAIVGSLDGYMRPMDACMFAVDNGMTVPVECRFDLMAFVAAVVKI